MFSLLPEELEMALQKELKQRLLFMNIFCEYVDKFGRK